MKGDQLGRQWRIIQILARNPGGKPSDDLAQELDEKKRVVNRDMEALQATGFPLTTEKNGGESCWKLADGYELGREIPFSLDELLALEAARSFMAPLNQSAFGDSLSSAHDKVAWTLPEGMAEILDGFRGAFQAEIGPSHDYGRMGITLKDLQHAIRGRNTVQINYRAYVSGEQDERMVDPYGFYFFSGCMYLVAWCHRLEEYRSFTLNRILGYEITEEHYVRRKDFDLDALTSKLLGSNIDQPRRVMLRFAPEVARYIKERCWHPSQKVTDDKDGGCTMALNVPDSGEIESWILSWGADCKVLEPQDLRDRIKKAHLKAAEG